MLLVVSAPTESVCKEMIPHVQDLSVQTDSALIAGWERHHSASPLLLLHSVAKNTLPFV